MQELSDGVRRLRIAVLAMALAIGAAPTAGLADDCRWEAVDENEDGVIDESESQTCGGEDIERLNRPCDKETDHDKPKCQPEDHSTHQWLNYHWTRPADAQRRIIIRDSTTWEAALGDALGDWAASADHWFTDQDAGEDETTRLNCDMPTNYGRVRVCNHANYPDFAPTTLGRAQVRVRGDGSGHIQRGRVRLDADIGAAERRALMCQEIGHTLGLEHRLTTGSCLFQDPNQANDHPDAHDYDQVEAQTHAHGGESLTGGVNADLDNGGGVEDGCFPICIDSASLGRYQRVVTVADHRDYWLVTIDLMISVARSQRRD